MKYKICAVYDSKAEAYMRPFFAQSTGAAIRSFSDEVNSSKGDSMLATHPEDYVLFELGTWEESKGLLEIYEAKKSLGSGVDFKRTVSEVRQIVNG